MILCVGTTPATQRVMVFRKLTLDAVNRAAITVDGIAGKSVNVAKVLQELGAEPLATGFIGGDRGEWVRAELARRGISTAFVTVTTRTRQCITVMDEATGTHTELVEEAPAVTAANYTALGEVIQERMAGCRAVVLSGTVALGGPPGFYATCVRLAQAHGVLSIVDAQGAALADALSARPGLIKPNRTELAASVGRDLRDDSAVRAAMRELHERGAQRVVITAGQAPTLAFDGRGFWSIVPPSIQAVNPIGSGDAFTAGLVWRLVQGDDLGESCRWGSAAGTANALTLMAGEVTRSDLDRLARETQVTPVS